MPDAYADVEALVAILDEEPAAMPVVVASRLAEMVALAGELTDVMTGPSRLSAQRRAAIYRRARRMAARQAGETAASRRSLPHQIGHLAQRPGVVGGAAALGGAAAVIAAVGLAVLRNRGHGLAELPAA